MKNKFIVQNQKYRRQETEWNFMKYLKQMHDAYAVSGGALNSTHSLLVYSVGTKVTRLKAAVHYIRFTLLVSRKSEKSYA